MKDKFKILRYACYGTNVSMSIVASLSPILFLTFRDLYGISFSLLGLLVLINFSSQLFIDLIFSFFSNKFNIEKTVKLTPFLTVLGLVLYSFLPLLFPQFAYIGIVMGTVIFSISSGLAEVLISPVIAAIPCNNPDREMSKLHSTYAWGVVFVIIFSTVFINFFSREKWTILALVLSIIPLLSGLLFLRSEMPSLKTFDKASKALSYIKNPQFLICLLAIFLGGASECTMAQWASSYLEKAIGLPKIYGDIFGVALFSVMLGFGRTLYSRIGKHIHRVLILGAIGTVLCYFTAAISPFPILGLVGCAMTGFCTSMLWPGNLIIASDKFKDGGVFIYAAMAAGGDLGASVVPQLVGIITDFSISNNTLSSIAARLNIQSETLGMKLGLLVGMLFPLAAIFVYLKNYKNSINK